MKIQKQLKMAGLILIGSILGFLFCWVWLSARYIPIVSCIGFQFPTQKLEISGEWHDVYGEWRVAKDPKDPNKVMVAWNAARSSSMYGTVDSERNAIAIFTIWTLEPDYLDDDVPVPIRAVPIGQADWNKVFSKNVEICFKKMCEIIQ